MTSRSSGAANDGSRRSDREPGLPERRWGTGAIDFGSPAAWINGGSLLILGIASRLPAIGSMIWMVPFYTAPAIWPENNPFLDDHVVYAIILAGIAYVGAGRYLGLGGWWEGTTVARRFRCFAEPQWAVLVSNQ